MTQSVPLGGSLLTVTPGTTKEYLQALSLDRSTRCALLIIINNESICREYEYW